MPDDIHIFHNCSFYLLKLLHYLCRCDRERSGSVQNNNVPTLSNRVNENKAYGRVPTVSQPRSIPLLPVISDPRGTRRVLQGTNGKNYSQRRPKSSMLQEKIIIIMIMILLSMITYSTTIFMITTNNTSY